MKSILKGLFAFSLLFAAPALAATAYDTPYATPSAIVCASDALCALINHIRVQAVTASGLPGSALYTWKTPCGSAPDAVFFIRPTGATTGCFTLEGFAASAPGGFALGAVSSTTGDIVSFANTGGKQLADSGIAASNVVLLTGSQSITGAKTFSNSDILMLGSSTGATTITSDNAGASNFTMHLPAANDTLADLAGIQTLTNKTISGSNNTLSNIANGSLTNSSIMINGTSVSLGGTRTLTLASSDFVNQGTTTTVLHGNAAGNPAFSAVVLTTDVSGILPGGNGGTGNGFFAVSGPATSLKTFTFPNASDTVDVLGTAQTFTAAKTFTNSDLLILGSSTGATTITSDNAGASNFTMHLPAANDTLADIAGVQMLTNKTISGSSNTLTNIGNSSLTNSATTVNGQTCTLGSTCTITAASKGYGLIADNAATLALSGTLQTIPMDTSIYDTLSICNTTTTKGVCTPNIAGTYMVQCSVDVTATTGPASLASLLLQVEIAKNGSAIATGGGDAIVWPQVASISSPRSTTIATNLVAVNGSTDTFSCVANSSSTSPNLNPGKPTVWLSYQYVGP